MARASLMKPAGGVLMLTLWLLAACGPAPAGPTQPQAAAQDAGGSRPAPAAGAGAAAPTSAPVEATPPGAPLTVRMGVLGILAESGVYIALERGYFAEEGIAPEFTTIDTGARAVPAMATGQLDVTGGGFSPSYANAVLRGVGMKIVASISRNEPDGNSGFTIVRKDLIDGGQVKDWGDLRGRIVAVPGRGSVNDYSVARGLEQAGLTIADVDLVELSYPDMAPALANASIDVAYATEPFATLSAERGLAVKWRPTADYLPGVTPALMSYAPAFLAEQPEAGRRWMIAYLRGARAYWAAFRKGEARAEVVGYLTRHTTVKDPALYERIGMSTIPPDGSVNLASLNDQAAWYAVQGLLQGSIDVASLIDTRFVDAAVARLGPYQP
jgi:NitT/TauT family transport system substrate-binding protein